MRTIISLAKLAEMLNGVIPIDVTKASAEICRAQVLAGVAYLIDMYPTCFVYNINQPVSLIGPSHCPLAQVFKTDFETAFAASGLDLGQLHMLAFTREERKNYNENETVFKGLLWNKAIEWIESILRAQLPKWGGFFLSKFLIF